MRTSFIKRNPSIKLWSWEPSRTRRTPKNEKWLKSDFRGFPQLTEKWPQKWLFWTPPKSHFGGQKSHFRGHFSVTSGETPKVTFESLLELGGGSKGFPGSQSCEDICTLRKCPQTWLFPKSQREILSNVLGGTIHNIGRCVCSEKRRFHRKGAFFFTVKWPCALPKFHTDQPPPPAPPHSGGGVHWKSQ